jgi:hypothetical protein
MGADNSPFTWALYTWLGRGEMMGTKCSKTFVLVPNPVIIKIILDTEDNASLA